MIVFTGFVAWGQHDLREAIGLGTSGSDSNHFGDNLSGGAVKPLNVFSVLNVHIFSC
jgi:hypothetical protein